MHTDGTHSCRELLCSVVYAAVYYVPPPPTEVVVAPTFLHIDYVRSLLRNPSIEVSAQNALPYKNGAYTGEVSAEQIKDAGLNWTILGHSERRQLFHTDDAAVGKQITLALGVGLKVIACVGETLEERKANQTMDVIQRQMAAIKAAVGTQWSSIVIAYEPVWAIGTGVTASPQQAQEVHANVRQWFTQQVSSQVASSIRIIYGGSVKGSNADELAKQRDIDGFLVGGAALIADEFIAIVGATQRAGPAKL